MKFLMIISLALLPLLPLKSAAEDAPPFSIIILTQKSNEMSIREVSKENLMTQSRWTSIKSIPPHRELNPEGLEHEYEGIELRRLIEEASRNTDETFFTVIGSDGYVVTLPFALLTADNALLAFRENGKPLTKRRGEQQIVFQTDKTPDWVAKKAAFWCWYVRGFVVGNLPNHLNFNKKKFINTSSLKNISHQTQFIAPSSYSYSPVNCTAPLAVPLQKLGTKIQQPSTFSHLRFLSLTGNSVDIHINNLNEYELLISKDEFAISPNCGGPFVVRKTKGPDEETQPNEPNVTTGIYAVEIK